MAKARIPAIAYLRTSSAANVGSNKDSDTRQRQAIAGGGHSRRAGDPQAGRTHPGVARAAASPDCGIVWNPS